MRPKEAKSKSDENDPILKSYCEYYMWRLQECINYWNIATGKSCIDIKIQHFYYCGLNALQTNFNFGLFWGQIKVGRNCFEDDINQWSLDKACIWIVMNYEKHELWANEDCSKTGIL